MCQQTRNWWMASLAEAETPFDGDTPAWLVIIAGETVPPGKGADTCHGSRLRLRGGIERSL